VYRLMPDTRGLIKLDEKAWYARHLIINLLDVDVPMISAVNGPCNMHSEVSRAGGQGVGSGQRVLPKDKVLDRAGAVGRNGKLVDAALMRHAADVLRRAVP
jgi:hypothetical protein